MLFDEPCPSHKLHIPAHQYRLTLHNLTQSVVTELIINEEQSARDFIANSKL